MKIFEPFTQVVHKALGSEPLVIVPNDGNVLEGQVVVRRAVTTQTSGTQFQTEVFWSDELETPYEALDREAELFRAMTVKKDELNSKPAGISHLN